LTQRRISTPSWGPPDRFRVFTVAIACWLRFNQGWVWGDLHMRNLGIAALCVAPVGCASSAAAITPTYVSPVQYSSYNCEQLALEAQSISARAAALSGAQGSQRTKDTVATTAAVVIFWPAGVLCRRRQADGCRARSDEGPACRSRAGLDRQEMQHSIPTQAA